MCAFDSLGLDFTRTGRISLGCPEVSGLSGLCLCGSHQGAATSYCCLWALITFESEPYLPGAQPLLGTAHVALL